jgi:hypothetical protein
VEKMIENGSGVKTDVDMKNGSMKFTNEEGTVTTGNALPDDWPKDIPTYPGATIQFSGTANPDNEAPGMATMMTTADSADAVATFYQTAMKNGGWKIESTMKSDIDRQAEGKEKSGVFSGAYAINPLNGYRMPIW